MDVDNAMITLIYANLYKVVTSPAPSPSSPEDRKTGERIPSKVRSSRSLSSFHCVPEQRQHERNETNILAALISPQTGTRGRSQVGQQAR